MKLIYCLLPILSTLAIAAPAFAVAQGKIFKDPLGAIYIYGLTPGESVLALGPYAPAKIVNSDACGLVRVTPLKSKPNGRIKFEGATIDPATLPVQPAPRCVNGVLEETRATNFKTILGLIVIKAAQPNQRYQMQWLDKPALRSQKANKCGYVKFPAGAFGDNPVLPTIDKKVATFKFTDLPQFPGLYCRNSTAQLWIPEGFPPQTVNAIDAAKPIEQFTGYDVSPTPSAVSNPIACRLGNSVVISNLSHMNRLYQLQTPSFHFGIGHSGTTKTSTFINMATTTGDFTTFGTFTLRDLVTSQTVITFQASTLAFCQ